MKDWKFEPTDPGCGLKQFIGEAVGAASMCWETPENAGVFESDKAAVIVEAIYDRAMSPDGARLGMATTGDLFRELYVRLGFTNAETLYALDLIRSRLSDDALNYRTVDE